MNGVQDPDAFKRLIDALQPWLDQVVIVGGWAHQLYRLHPGAQQLEYQPLGTLDADVALPATLPVREPDIRERLLAYGFTEEILGYDHPPATHYCLAGVYCGRGSRVDKALCCEEVRRGGLYYPRWVICNWSNPRVLARAC
jgi:hypothetical protein